MGVREGRLLDSVGIGIEPQSLSRSGDKTFGIENADDIPAFEGVGNFDEIIPLFAVEVYGFEGIGFEIAAVVPEKPVAAEQNVFSFHIIGLQAADGTKVGVFDIYGFDDAAYFDRIVADDNFSWDGHYVEQQYGGEQRCSPCENITSLAPEQPQ